MAGQLDGKVAIVTGSTRSIGKAVAIAFADEGAEVVVCGRTSERSGPDEATGSVEATAREITSRGGEALAVQCDVTSEESVRGMVEATVARWGRIDMLFNNAAFLWRWGLLGTPTTVWNQIVRTNLDGPYLCTMAVLPHMMAQKAGCIINATSGRSTAEDGRTTAYTITKVGLERLTVNLAAEVREHGIAVNALDPGPVLTKGVIDAIDDKSRLPNFFPVDDERVKVVPACIHLASTSSNPDTFLTGQLLKASELIPE